MPTVRIKGTDRVINFPDEMDKESIAAELRRNLVGAGEVGLSMASSAAGDVLGGLAGIAALPFGVDASTKVIRDVQDAIRYDPSTDEAQGAMRYMGETMQPFMDTVDMATDNLSRQFRIDPRSSEGQLFRDIAPALAGSVPPLAGARMLPGREYEMGDIGSGGPGGRQRGMFAGVKAKNADLDALDQAKSLKEAGATREEILQNTGWFEGVDGGWRFEIDDSGSELTPNAMESSGSLPLSVMMGDAPRPAPFDSDVGDFIRHDELYGNYPQVSQYALEDTSGGGGNFQPFYSEILEDDTGRIRVGTDQSASGRRSTALHEIQHAIQQREGFARGGSPKTMGPAPVFKDIDDLTEDEWATVSDIMQRNNIAGDSMYENPAEFLSQDVYPELIKKDSGRDVVAVKEIIDRYKAPQMSPLMRYRRLAGEAEARNVETRRDFTPEERRRIPPWETLDVVEGDQIVRRDGGVSEKTSSDPGAGTTEFTATNFDPRFAERKSAAAMNQMAENPTRIRKNYVVEDNLPEMSIFDMEGRPFVTSMSDRTDARGSIVGINDVDFQNPVRLLGGQDFMLEGDSVWASGEGPINDIARVANQVKEMSGGQEPIYVPWRMSPTGSNFATMTGETMLEYARSGMNKKQKKGLDKFMKSQIKDWKGIENPESTQQFNALGSDKRKAVQERMDRMFRDAGGLDYTQTRLAIADPRQLESTVGNIQNIGLIDTLAGKQPSTHPSYPFEVKGQALGRIKEEIPIWALDPRRYNDLRADSPLREIEDVANMTSADRRALEMGAAGGIITEKQLRRLEKLIAAGILSGTGGAFAEEEFEE